MSALDDALAVAAQGLDVKKRLDRVAGCYLRRRGSKLAAQHPDWTAERLTDVLLVERAAIGTYAREKTAQLLGGTDPKQPGHLNLAVQARIFAGSNWAVDKVQQLLAARYRRDREEWIWQIAWRAVMVHDDQLWTAPPPQPRRLATAALDEMVDRRLRVVERMTCNVNTAGFGLNARERAWSVEAPFAPWRDGMLTRVFEYPFLPLLPVFRRFDTIPDWRISDGSMMYDPGPGVPPVRFPSGLRTSWRPRVTDAGTIWINYRGADAPVGPSDMMRRLFSVPRFDFWERTWLFCDMAGAALNLEALWFGLSRREGSEATFDAVLRRPDYVQLGPVVQYDGTQDLDRLMIDEPGDDDFFENTEVALADLQVGDFVVFWNSRIYAMLTGGAWGNEFSHVMGVDADPATGKVRVTADGPQVWLAGHGIHTTSYSGMAQHLVRHIADELETRRKRITDAVAGDPTVTSVGPFVRWAPYEEFDAPGAWWLQIPRSRWNGDWAYPDLDAVVAAVPRSVVHDPAGGTGYRRPPDITAAYFPLWEPKVASTGDSWRGYLQQRRKDQAFQAPTALAPLKVDANLASGLFYRGSGRPIRVVRPQVRV